MYSTKSFTKNLSLCVSYIFPKFDGSWEIKVWCSLWYHPIILSPQHEIVHLLATKVYPTIETNRGNLVNYGEQTHKDSTCGLALKACQEHTRSLVKKTKQVWLVMDPFLWPSLLVPFIQWKKQRIQFFFNLDLLLILASRQQI
jgi:hypothetical protein